MRLTSPVSSMEGGLACPMAGWVDLFPGLSSDSHIKANLPEPLPRTTTAHPQRRIAAKLASFIILPTVAKCPELPQAHVVGRSGGLWAGTGVGLVQGYTVRPQLSGPPPRWLYFLGITHRYEDPQLPSPLQKVWPGPRHAGS